jgi:hypothetical protein
MNDRQQEQEIPAGELSQDQLAQAAGGMINVRVVVASTVTGGALRPTYGGSVPLDLLDELSLER